MQAIVPAVICYPQHLPALQIMGTAAVGVAQKEDDEHGIDEQDIFDGVVLFLAALTRGLLRRVLRADDTPFGPVMGKSRYAE